MKKLLLLALIFLAVASAEVKAQEANMEGSGMNMSVVLGGGCFWCVEAVFERIEGVTGVVSGYAGGTVPNPSYEEVCTGKTGHAEVVRITYDPAVISLSAILDLFFKAHDPTTPNRQGADVGTQYRSVIFYANPTEKRDAEAAVKRAQAHYAGRIVTEILPQSPLDRKSVV